MTLHIGWVKWWLIVKWSLTFGLLVLMPLAWWLHWQSQKVQRERWSRRRDKLEAQKLGAKIMRERWVAEHPGKRWEQH